MSIELYHRIYNCFYLYRVYNIECHKTVTTSSRKNIITLKRKSFFKNRMNFQIFMGDLLLNGFKLCIAFYCEAHYFLFRKNQTSENGETWYTKTVQKSSRTLLEQYIPVNRTAFLLDRTSTKYYGVKKTTK